MRKTKQIQETKEEIEITCDVCGNNKYYKYLTCWMCRRDLCDRKECMLFDPRDPGDYPKVFCLKCWNIGVDYCKAMIDAENQYEEAIDKIEKQWESACITARTADSTVRTEE